MMYYRVYTLFLTLLWLLQAAMSLSPYPHEQEEEQQQDQKVMLNERDMTQIKEIILESERRICDRIVTMMDYRFDTMGHKLDLKNIKVDTLAMKLERVEARLQPRDVKFRDPVIMYILGTFLAQVLSVAIDLGTGRFGWIFNKKEGQN